MAATAMVIECTYRYVDTGPAPVSLLWLALALSIGCFGAMLALLAGPLVGLALASLALGMTLGFLALEVMTRWNESN